MRRARPGYEEAERADGGVGGGELRDRDRRRDGARREAGARIDRRRRAGRLCGQAARPRGGRPRPDADQGDRRAVHQEDAARAGEAMRDLAGAAARDVCVLGQDETERREHCVSAVTNELNGLAGVSAVTVDLVPAAFRA